MVEYLKIAGPCLTTGERRDVTRDLAYQLCTSSFSGDETEQRPFAAWLSRQADGVAKQWRTAFEEWYLGELGSDAQSANPERSERALLDLMKLVRHYGGAGMGALFPKHGHAGLHERLKVCARSPDPYLASNAKELRELLRTGRKLAVGTITSREGEKVSLQIVMPAVILHIEPTYQAENLLPGLQVNPTNGVISGRIQAGAASNSPYKVSLTRHAQGRQNPDQVDHASFIWQVRPGEQRGD
jgi:hypothetical protein